MPKISVIVPIYKVEKYLIQCIDSILRQTLEDIEVILVDEGDLDCCRDICDMYEFGAKKDKRIKTIHEKNGGYGISVNKGFDIAQGEYISIVESDDFIAPRMYEEMYAYAKKLDADVVKTPYFEYWDKTKGSEKKILLCPFYEKMKSLPENRLLKIEDCTVFMGGHPSVWSAIYRLSYIKTNNIRFTDVKGAMYVDRTFLMQIMYQTDKIAWMNKTFYYYRLSNTGSSSSTWNLDQAISRWTEIHKLGDEKFPEKWNKIAPYSIAEEWLNVYRPIIRDKYRVTETQWQTIVYNLSKTSKDQISKSPLLSPQDKQSLVQFKKNSGRLKKYVVKSQSNLVDRKKCYVAQYKLKLCGVSIAKVEQKRENKWRALLFGIIPCRLIRCF